MPARPETAGGGSRGGRWGDLRLRAASAAVLVPLALLCLWAGGAAWLALVAVAAIGLAFEWWTLWRRGRADGKATPVLVLAAGALYLLPAIVALPWLRAAPAVGFGNVLFVLLIVWGSDIGAYLVGRWLGGPKLAPAISPGKTWSGAGGGLLAALVIGVVFTWGWPRDGAGQGVGVALVLSVASQLGDLFESVVKRYYGVKDSSRLIPGHGGLLDRLDGVLAAAPVAGVISLCLGPGLALW